MSTEPDITGKKYGRLTAIKKTRLRYWLFKCDCGVEVEKKKGRVVSLHTRSCGCLQADNNRSGNNRRIHGDGSNSNGLHPLYKKWREMIKRCHGKHKYFARYGGRGIVVCDEWRNDYQTFKLWALGSGWKKELTIERKDNDGPYTPDNCRWATAKEQARNRSTSRMITFNDETKTLAEWSESSGVPYSTLAARIDRLGWSFERAIEKC